MTPVNNVIVLAYDNYLTDENQRQVRKLSEVFDIRIHSSWSDDITHLVVQCYSTGHCLRTAKYLNALVSHSYIVDMQWVNDSLSFKSLQLEVRNILQ